MQSPNSLRTDSDNSLAQNCSSSTVTTPPRDPVTLFDWQIVKSLLFLDVDGDLKIINWLIYLNKRFYF